MRATWDRLDRREGRLTRTLSPWLLASAIAVGVGCSGDETAATVGPDATDATAADATVLSDGALPTDDVTPIGGPDAIVDPDADPCNPTCEDGVCGPDGCGGACAACGDLPKAYGTACKLDGEVASPAQVTLAPAFGKIVFDYPVHLTPLPDGRLLIVEKRGFIKVMPDDETADGADLELFLDIMGRVSSTTPEAGLLSVALHPNFADNKRFFVNYTATINSKLTTVIARFEVGDDGMGKPDSEERLLTILQPFSNHNGGQIAFGPEGMLYIGMGDGGSAGDPKGYAQNPEELLGKMLRIDVDAPVTPGLKYAIPKDNPFVGSEDGTRDEIWALGLRNPWRFSFDPLTGNLWAADVGQKKWEEVHLIEKGKNYGWNIMEGGHCYNPALGCDLTGLELPVVEYSHDIGQSITGGFVYRGSAIPSLIGAYVYADYVSGLLFAARFGADGTPEWTQIGDTLKKITSFGQSADGEIFVVHASVFDPQKGEIFRMIPAADAPPTGATFPRKLSETGCYTDLETLTPAAGLFPYELNAPLWHDGADSVRHISLPPATSLIPSDGEWTVPEGGKVIKTFVYPRPDGSLLKLETRFILQRADGIRAYSYRWNDAGTDAELLETASTRDFALPGGTLPGGTLPDGGEARTWHYPSRSQCLECHNAAAGRFLGFRTAQLDAPGVAANGRQIDHFEATGLVAWAVDTSKPPFPNPADASAPLHLRARAAVDVNCATCHQPGASPITKHDLRYGTGLAETGVCDVAPENGSFGVEGEKLLAPGQPDASNLLLRMKDLGELRMPSIGSHVVDDAAVTLITEWIQSLDSCAGP